MAHRSVTAISPGRLNRGDGVQVEIDHLLKRLRGGAIAPAFGQSLEPGGTFGLDRDQPMQTALGIVTPVPVVETGMGPPHVGATGWLFHLDAPNLVLTSLRPAADGCAYAAAHVRQTQNNAKPTPLHTSHTRACARSARQTGAKPPRHGNTHASIGNVSR